jgi:hypothetical protein
MDVYVLGKIAGMIVFAVGPWPSGLDACKVTLAANEPEIRATMERKYAADPSMMDCGRQFTPDDVTYECVASDGRPPVDPYFIGPDGVMRCPKPAE